MGPGQGSGRGRVIIRGKGVRVGLGGNLHWPCGMYGVGWGGIFQCLIIIRAEVDPI